MRSLSDLTHHGCACGTRSHAMDRWSTESSRVSGDGRGRSSFHSFHPFEWCLSSIKSLPPPPPPTTVTAIVPKSLLGSALTVSNPRHLVRCAGLSGTMAICLGVYGAHAMRDNSPEELKRVS
jgi:hypothetical protein